VKTQILPFVRHACGSNERRKQAFKRVEKVLEVTSQLKKQSKKAEGDPIKTDSHQTIFWVALLALIQLS